MKGMKLVLIEWLDSHSGRGWQPMDQIASATEPLYCRSVGWLVSESDQCKVIVPHVSGEKNAHVMLHGSGDLAILKKAIVRTRILQRDPGELK